MTEEKKQNPLEAGKTQGKVGYKNPPKEYQFKPGQSGNPGGKTKGKSTSALLRELLDEIPKGQTMSRKEALARVMLILGIQERNIKMIEQILDRTEGKPKQSVELEHKGEPLPIEIIHDRKKESKTPQLPDGSHRK